MNKAIFLDRDGVINYERGDYTFKVDDFKLNIGLISTLKYFQNKNYLLIVISNQGGISKNLYSKSDVDTLHKYFIKECKKENIKITDFYFCPHHNDLENCLCRKPKTLMLEKAISKYKINPLISFFIGDNYTDKIVAELMNITPIIVKNNDLLSIKWKEIIF